MILETYLNENRLLEVNQIEFDKMINENTYYLTEGFTDNIKSIGNKVWENIKKVFKKIIEGLKWIKSKTIDKIINLFKNKVVKKKADAEAKNIIAEMEKNDSDIKNKKIKIINYESIIKAFEEKSNKIIEDNERASRPFVYDLYDYDDLKQYISDKLIVIPQNGKIDENDILNRYNIMEYEIKEDFSNEIIETLELDDDINTENIEDVKKLYKEKMTKEFNSDEMFDNDNCTIISFEEFKNNYEKINNKINDTMNKYIDLVKAYNKKISLLIDKIKDTEKATKNILDDIVNECNSYNYHINNYELLLKIINKLVVMNAEYDNKTYEVINYKIQVDSLVLLNMKFYKVVE